MENDAPHVTDVESFEEGDLDPKSIFNSLCAASSDGHLDIVKQLLEAWLESPDPQPPRYPGDPLCKLQRALEVAVASDKLVIAAYLLEKGFRVTQQVVEPAVENHSIRALELLLQHGWDINDRWRRFRLPSICVAIRLSSMTLVTWFLDHSASANLKPNSYNPSTPLSVAASQASLEINRLLISHGADATIGDVLFSAIRSYRSETDREPVIRYLIEAGAPVNALRYENNPGKLKVVLARHGVVETPLHMAVKEGKWRLARVLMECGADWARLDSHGRSAREAAREKGGEGMLEEIK